MVLALALVVGGCSSSAISSTPTGLSCTHVSNDVYKDGCYYFMSNGASVPCNVNLTENYLCTNSDGAFYDYNGITTYRCENQICTTHAPISGGNGNCSPGFMYSNLVNNGRSWEAINQLEDQNTTRATISTRFISTSATTVSTTASIDITANINALLGVIFASVHAQINASVAKTASTVVGNEVTIAIPAGETAYGVYGVNVQVTTGHLYQSNTCGSAGPNYGNVKTYVPIASGWCVWLSGQTPCRVVQGN